MEIDILKKGKQGEAIVAQAIGKIDFGKGLVINNAIFKFPSILSKDGYMTTQIDHLVLTENIIMCIETKYYEHLMEHDFAAMEWKTDYNEEVENPIWQNRKHKEILSNVFRIKLEDIITIEVVLGSDISGYMATNEHPNDYICDEKSVTYLIGLLLVSEHKNDFVFENLKSAIKEKCLTYGVEEHELDEIEAEHVQRLKFANRINVWLRRRNKRMFHFCDIAYCQECGRLLAFRSFNSLKPGKQKESIDFLVGCTGYNTSSEAGCRSKAIYDFEQIDRMNFLVLEEEKQNMTMVELMEVKESLEKSADRSKKQVQLLQCEISELKTEMGKLKNKINVLENEKKALTEEKNKFKKVFGVVYYKRQ